VYLANMKLNGAYHDMFSLSPSWIPSPCPSWRFITFYFSFPLPIILDAIVPRDLHPKALMYDISVAKGRELISHGLELIADPMAYEAKMQLQGRRFVNCVPPIGFDAWEQTGRSLHGMPCWRSIIGVNHLRSILVFKSFLINCSRYNWSWSVPFWIFKLFCI
jgi:hypothetical protein